jgi:outer membrane protein assembly factor BamE (lipoprotein component of BamABCDE complex)
MFKTAPLSAALALVALSGCVLGRTRDESPIDQDKVAKIVPGQSTKKDVVDLLGAPSSVHDRVGFRMGERGAGAAAPPVLLDNVRSPLDHSYTYEYTDTKSQSLYLLVVSFTNQETKHDRVTVFFDEKGVVTHVGITLDARNVEFRLPTSD